MTITGRHRIGSHTTPETGDLRPNYEPLLYWALVLAPLQRAFTIDLGFPFKACEILIMLAIGMYLLTPRKSRVRPKPGIETVLAGGIAVIVALSGFWYYQVSAPDGPYFGYNRGPTTDLLMYTFYGFFALMSWWLILGVSFARIRDALVKSVWVTLLTTVMQWFLVGRGETRTLELLNFQTKAKGFQFFGDASENAARSGPFVEGQHLGFYAGAILIVCVLSRRWLAAIAASACLFYSLSTSGFIGLAAATASVFLLLPRAIRLVRVVAAAAAVILAFLSVPALRLIIRLQLSKLGVLSADPVFGARDTGASRDLRTIKTDIGLQMMLDHPILGVGAGRYGVHFFDYPTEGVPGYYFRENHRAIAENAYAHVGSELGIIALLLFALLFLVLIRRQLIMRSGYLALAVFLTVGISTQSSWTFLPIWMFAALLTRHWLERGDGGHRGSVPGEAQEPGPRYPTRRHRPGALNV